MHQRKLAAKPQSKYTPKHPKHPHNYDRCECGNWKSTQANLCKSCRLAIKPFEPIVNGKFVPPPLPKNNFKDEASNKCPSCKGNKSRVASLCVTCHRADKRPPIDNNVYIIEREECCRIPLTKGLYSWVNKCDYRRLMKWRWQACRVKDKDIYYAGASMRIKGRIQLPKMHHVIFNDVTLSVHHHRDHNPLNNRRSNLIKCTYSQNGASRGVMKNNTTGYRGIRWNKERKRWKVYIGFNRKRVYVGDFRDKVEAAKAYDAVALKYFGEFAYLNFPQRRV